MGKYSNVIEGIKRILQLAEKPDTSEYTLMLKLVLLGFLAVGAIAFGVWLLMYYALIYGGVITPTTTP